MSLHLSSWKKWNIRGQTPHAPTTKFTIFPAAKPIHSAFLPVAVDDVGNSKGKTSILILPSQSHMSASDRWKLNHIQISNDKQARDHFFSLESHIQSSKKLWWFYLQNIFWIQLCLTPSTNSYHPSPNHHHLHTDSKSLLTGSWFQLHSFTVSSPNSSQHDFKNQGRIIPCLWPQLFKGFP